MRTKRVSHCTGYSLRNPPYYTAGIPLHIIWDYISQENAWSLTTSTCQRKEHAAFKVFTGYMHIKVTLHISIYPIFKGSIEFFIIMKNLTTSPVAIQLNVPQ